MKRVVGHFEKVKPQSVEALRIALVGWRESHAAFRNHPHQHDRIQVYWVVQGEAEVLIDGEWLPIRKQQLVVILPEKQRTIRWRAGHLVYGYLLLQSCTLPLKRLSGKVWDLSPSSVEAMAEVSVESRQAGGDYQRFYCEALFAQVCIQLLREAEEREDPLGEKNLDHRHHEAVVSRVIQYMAQNLDHPLGREELAGVACLSYPHLARIFKTVTGETMRQTLTDLRLDQARELLVTSTLPITDISLEVGFNSFSHFTQLFKKKMGKTPSRFRKDNQKPAYIS